MQLSSLERIDARWSTIVNSFAAKEPQVQWFDSPD